MDLRLTEFQELLRDNAAAFLEREAPLTRVREIEASGRLDAELWTGMTGLGWPGLPVAAEYGGQGGSLIDCAVLIEQLCRAAVLSPYRNSVLAASTVQVHGDEALRRGARHVLARVLVGDPISAGPRMTAAGIARVARDVLDYLSREPDAAKLTPDEVLRRVDVVLGFEREVPDEPAD